MKKLFTEIPHIVSEDIVLKKLEMGNKDDLTELVHDPMVYRYLPTFLYEKKYHDIEKVIKGLYTECFKESIILGIFKDDVFVGLIELYGYREKAHKISVGYRLLSKYWGRGIATKALRLMIDYLYNETEIEIITASTMLENRASAKVLEKNGFSLVVHDVGEDWGYEKLIPTDKWIM